MKQRIVLIQTLDNHLKMMMLTKIRRKKKYRKKRTESKKINKSYSRRKSRPKRNRSSLKRA